MATLRESLDAAFSSVAPETASPAPAPAPAPAASPASLASPASPASPASTPAVDTSGAAPGLYDAPADPVPAKPTPAPAPGIGEMVRDGLGRFVAKGQTAQNAPGAPQAVPGAPGTTQPQLAAPGAAQAPPEPLAAPAAPVPPTAWRAEAKAEWAKLPPTVQGEVARRELDMARAMTENASARSIAQQFTDTVTPYLPFVRAEGATNPLEAIRSMFDVVVELRTGSAYQKAAAISRIINAYGVDIEALDSALVGKAQEDPQVKMQQEIEARVKAQMAPFQQLINQAQQARTTQQQSLMQQVDAEMATFQQSRPHFETVRGLMADLMESAQRNKFELTMADAYEQALRLHPSTKGATIAAQTAQTAAQMNEAAQRAKRAAVGARVPVQSSTVPAGANGVAPNTLRGAIIQAMQEVPLA